MDKIVIQQMGQPIYSIYIEASFDAFASLIGPFSLQNRKICIVSDSHVASFHLSALVSALKDQAGELTTFVFPAGESQKNLDTVQALYQHLIQYHFDRKDMLIALGGGVTGDLTGYAAATYLRGISFIQVPTSLLAQVDSSIGGKTGVDFQQYKNMIGAFHMPSMVYMSLHTLKTLPQREYLSGMAEIIKHGLIQDRSYFYWLKVHMEEVFSQQQDALSLMIRKSCEIKGQIVEEDPFEKGNRALLNFGHTLGHAIEKQYAFSWLHGECVSVGCVAAAYLSYKRGYLSNEDMTDIENCLESYRLPVRIQGLDPAAILEDVKSDKKMDGGQIRFILLKEIGSAFIDTTVTEKEMDEALSYIME